MLSCRVANGSHPHNLSRVGGHSCQAGERARGCIGERPAAARLLHPQHLGQAAHRARAPAHKVVAPLPRLARDEHLASHFLVSFNNIQANLPAAMHTIPNEQCWVTYSYKFLHKKVNRRAADVTKK